MSKRIDPKTLDLKDKLVAVNRVAKTVKGGRNMRLAALVVVALILIIYELVKLHRISTDEIKEPSIYNTRNTIEKMEDKSEDSKIAIKVDDLLQKEGLIEVPKDDEPEIKETGDEN